METKFAFLDSTEFNSNSFNFESYKLKSLRARGKKRTIKILITDIVYREILSQLGEYVEKAHTDTRALITSDKFRTLRHLLPESAKALADVDFTFLRNESKKLLDAFIKDARIEIIGTGDVRAADILDLYFKKLPPFGESKKKDEFPDAINLVALKNWCEKKDQKLYVVSKDSDLSQLSHISNRFIKLVDLGHLLEIITEYEQRNKREFDRFIRSFSSNYSREIEDQIEEIFLNMEFFSDDYELDAEFSELTVKKIDVLSSYVINADEERIMLDVSAHITYQSDVKHHDYENAAYDSEDGKYIYVSKTKYAFEEAISINGTLEFEIISFPPKSWEDLLFTDQNLDPDIVEVDLEDVTRV